MDERKYRALTPAEIEALDSRNCYADDWSRVRVAEGFDHRRLYGVGFHGEVEMGRLDGTVRAEGGAEKRAGIIRAVLRNCTIGDNVVINGIGSHIANYNIGDGAAIEGVGVMATEPGSTFGNGVEVETVNEGGGRGIPIFNELTSQIAYLVALHRYRGATIEKLSEMIGRYVETVRSDRGEVGAGCVIRDVPEIINVSFGAACRVMGAASLRNGTVLSDPADPTTVGSNVVAEDFIIAEGASATQGVILSRCFVGQGTRLGKQFSAENSLFFANCEGFHGEACSIFAGPYTVTHHKSTLMIAGVFSFFNAGSGSNQSNHMYKLGPIHQGVLERGSKTGSFSYLLWPCGIGPFSVVIGKHGGNFDLRELPFSYVTAEEGGRTYVVPGMNLYTVGTVRDGAKWPSRDRRKTPKKRDQILFETFSPYTVGRMISGEKLTAELAAKTDKSVEEVHCNGALVKRILLRTGARTYRNGVEMYLAGKIFARAKEALSKPGGGASLKKALGPPEGGLYSEAWTDVAGLLVGLKRLRAIEDNIESGRYRAIRDVAEAFARARGAYEADEWAWVRESYKARCGKYPEELSADELAGVAEAWRSERARFIKAVLSDAAKEYGEVSQIGFGLDGDERDRAADFAAVRGTYDADKFVKEMEREMAAVEREVAAFKAKVAPAAAG